LEKYLRIFIDSFIESADWTWRSLIFEVPWYINYFWGLTAISLLVWGIEMLFPWRKEQAVIRKDFWLDGAYMYFNFFIFSSAISGLYTLMALIFEAFGVSSTSFTILHIGHWPMWGQLLVFFVVLDFAQWFTHMLLHKYPLFWRFHKIHHSIKEMGFAGHLRYHWMENIFYKPLKTLAVMILGGFEPEHAYSVHFFAIAIGHLNHANVKITWGPLKYLFNNPVMHLYHHSYLIPQGTYGVNFGISLSLWDYLFKTHYVPEDSGTIELGFPGDEEVPKNFFQQLFYGFGKSKE